MKNAKKGDWVKIYETVLHSSERSTNLPEDTKKSDLKMWVKGFLQNDAKIGEVVEVVTKTGRVERGILEEINPTYTISFGSYVPELAVIGMNARKELSEVK